ncbi:MAG: cohesin domain-containing protein [Syntrophomonas sp.]|nr:cohesin domain-containing protein [Syntrophomonas sp.]
MQIRNSNIFKSILSAVLVFAMAFGVIALKINPAVDAKTSESARADNIFFYVSNSEGKNVLLEVISLSELEAISHGQLSNLMTGTDSGQNYYFSCTDNLPTTVYTEVRGITLPELVAHVKNNSTVSGAVYISYTGSDQLYFMATDSNGTYNKNWTYDQLYGDTKYYFPGLFISWNDGWEISDNTYGPTDTNPIPLDIYNSAYKASDSYYNAKRTVFNNGQPTIPILATKLEMDRVSNLSSEIAANGGNVTGCLKNALTTDRVLQLCLPQSEAVLMSGNRTAYHNFAWIYNMKLAMANAPSITSLGTVAAPTAAVTQNGNTLSITMNCSTAGAQIYYSLSDGSPQTLYNGPVSCDVANRDLATSPITFAMTAVKEGYDDAGIISVTYPQRGPVFTDIYTARVGDDVTFAADSTVSVEDWNTWKNRIVSVSVKYPGASAYTPLDNGKYRLDDSGKTITFDQSLFSAFGSHSFLIAADSYANKTMSVTMKKAAPTVETTDYYMGSDIALSFADTSYQTGMSVSIKATETASPNSISSSYLTQTVPGKLTLKKSYFSSANCVITAPGTYMLTLNNSNYVPSSQTVSITVKDASGKPPGTTFAYTLTPSSSVAEVGDTITVSVNLSSGKNSYKFYAGEYRLVLDNTYLTLAGVTCQGNWESGSKTADGKTTLTFAALDKTNQGIDSGSSTEIGNFTLKVIKEGSASILCSRALLTDANAEALADVGGSDLQITVGDGVEQPRPAGIYTISPIDDPAYTIGSTGDGIAVMTVNAGNEGIKSFAISIVSEQAHSGSETAVFVHLRNGAQITMDTFEDDYETVNTVSTEFNVQAGDVVKAYIVDEMRKATNFNPFVLQ